MSERTRPRRDDDPVHVYDDGRIAYWTGGSPGVGERKWARAKAGAPAEARGNEIRDTLAAGLVPARRGALTVFDLANAFRDHHESSPAGTQRTYRSKLNTDILPEIGAAPVRDLRLSDYVRVLDRAVADGKAVNTIHSIGTVLNALVTFGEERDWFGTQPPFGAPAKRRAALKRAKQRARSRAGATKPTRIGLADVPTWDEVETYAAAFEAQYPERGAAAARAQAGSGLRPSEFLALRVADVDLERGVFHVRTKLERGADWPTLAPPKDAEVREVPFWEHVRPDIEFLVEHAHEDGWLCPPVTAAQRKWLASWDLRSKHARQDCGWPERFKQYTLRHHFATYSLASVEDGGYGFSLATVSLWLGHASTHHTSETYNHPGLHRPEEVAVRTAGRPGIRRPASQQPS